MRLGVSLTQVARDAGVSPGYLSRLERMDQGPEATHVSDEVLMRLTHVLDLDALEAKVAAGLLQPGELRRIGQRRSFESFIEADPELSSVERHALIGLYRTFVPRERGNGRAPEE